MLHVSVCVVDGVGVTFNVLLSANQLVSLCLKLFLLNKIAFLYHKDYNNFPQKESIILSLIMLLPSCSSLNSV